MWWLVWYELLLLNSTGLDFNLTVYLAYLYLIFAILQFEISIIEFDELDFFSSLNWIFLPAVACRIQLKIKFIKLNFSNWRIAKIKTGNQRKH